MNIYEDQSLYPYITGAMLGKARVVKEIAAFEYQNVFNPRARREERTPVLKFKDSPKILILSRTNIDIIVSLYGPETDHWIGKKLELHVENMTVGGRPVAPIRVGLPKAT